MMKLKALNDPTYRGYEVNVGQSPENLPYYTKILDRCIDQITNLHSHYSRIDVVRFDTKIPKKLGATILQMNRLVSRFIDKVKKKLSLSEWGCHNKVAHGWVFEISERGSKHHHLFLALRHTFKNIGSLNPRRPTGLWKLLTDCAKETFGGKLYFSKFHVVNRNNQDEINSCVKHLSYMAKVRTKDFGTRETHKRFGFSQIKPSENKNAQKATKYAAQQAMKPTPSHRTGRGNKIEHNAPQAA